MNVVIFLDRFVTGGVESVCSALSRQLTKNGHRTCFVIGSKPSVQMDNGSVEVISLSPHDYSKLSVFSPSPRSRVYQFIKSADVFLATAPLSLAIAYNCVRTANADAKLLAGIFAQDAFPSTMTYHSRLFLDGVHDENKLFMNTLVREWHRTRADGQFSESTIWPIPIDTQKYQNVVRRPRRNLIVSVGRLSDFKPYNYQMPCVLRWLVDNGIDIQWEIVGDDEIPSQSIKARMEEEAETHGVSDRIIWHGTKDHEFIVSRLSEAGGFVGMGMAAVQAASAGVPTVVAIARNPEPTSFGLFHELEAGHIGEPLPHRVPSRLIADDLLRVIRADNYTYSLLSAKHRQAAQVYGSANSYQLFLDAVAKARPNVVEVPGIRVYKASKLSKAFLRRLSVFCKA